MWFAHSLFLERNLTRKCVAFKTSFYLLVPDRISIVEVKSQKMFEIQDIHVVNLFFCWCLGCLFVLWFCLIFFFLIAER